VAASQSLPDAMVTVDFDTRYHRQSDANTPMRLRLLGVSVFSASCRTNWATRSSLSGGGGMGVIVVGPDTPCARTVVATGLTVSCSFSLRGNFSVVLPGCAQQENLGSTPTRPAGRERELAQAFQMFTQSESKTNVESVAHRHRHLHVAREMP